MTEEFEIDDDLHPIDPGRVLCAHADSNGEGAHWRNADEPCDYCPLSRRVDGPKHSWHFDGDDPRIVCAFCGEVRDALSGRVL